MSLDNFMLWYKGFLLFSKIHRHVSRLIIHCGYHWQYLVEERSAGAENWAFNISSKVIGYLSRHSREASWIQWTKEQFYQRYNIHFWTIIPFLHIHIFSKAQILYWTSCDNSSSICPLGKFQAVGTVLNHFQIFCHRLFRLSMIFNVDLNNNFSISLVFILDL